MILQIFTALIVFIPCTIVFLPTSFTLPILFISIVLLVTFYELFHIIHVLSIIVLILIWILIIPHDSIIFLIVFLNIFFSLPKYDILFIFIPLVPCTIPFLPITFSPFILIISICLLGAFHHLFHQAHLFSIIILILMWVFIQRKSIILSILFLHIFYVVSRDDKIK